MVLTEQVRPSNPSPSRISGQCRHTDCFRRQIFCWAKNYRASVEELCAIEDWNYYMASNLFARPPLLTAKPLSELILRVICFDFHGVVLVTEKGFNIPLGIFPAEFSNGTEFLILFNVIGFMTQQYQQVTILVFMGLP